MLFIRNGIHMVALGPNSVINIQPNPKFVRNDKGYGAIMLNMKNPIGVYPLTSDDTSEKTVYDVYDSIIRQIQMCNEPNGIINIPTGYKFESIDEFTRFKELLTNYDKEEMVSIYYNSLKAANNATSK